VELIESYVKLADGAHDDTGEQGCPVGIEEPVKGSADGIIGKRHHLIRSKPEALWSKAADHFVLPVNRLSLNEDGAEKHAEGLAIGHTYAPVLSGNKSIQVLVQFEPRDEAVDQRERSQSL